MILCKQKNGNWKILYQSLCQQQNQTIGIIRKLYLKIKKNGIAQLVAPERGGLKNLQNRFYFLMQFFSFNHYSCS